MMSNVLWIWILTLFLLEIPGNGQPIEDDVDLLIRICFQHCRAICYDTASRSRERVEKRGCGKSCKPMLQAHWISKCGSDVHCKKSCNFTIVDSGYGTTKSKKPSTPSSIEVVRTLDAKAKLTFTMGNSENSSLTTLYVLEKVPHQRKYTIIKPAKSRMFKFNIHSCSEFQLRLLAVNRYGYSNFSEPWKGKLIPSKPEAITNIQLHPPKRVGESQYEVRMTWSLPKGWKTYEINKNQIQIEYTIKSCISDPWLLQPTIEKKEKESVVLGLKGLNCIYTGKIRLLPKCGPPGDENEFEIDFTDCRERYPEVCPLKQSFVADGIVSGEAIPYNDVEFGLYELRWKPPKNLGVHVLANYVIDWGKLKLANYVKIIDLVSPSEGQRKLSGDVTSYNVTITNPWEKYGFRVGPIETEKRSHSLDGMGLFMLHEFPKPDTGIVDAWNYVSKLKLNVTDVREAVRKRWLLSKTSFSYNTTSDHNHLKNNSYPYSYEVPGPNRVKEKLPPLAHHIQSLPQNLAIYVAIPVALLLLTISAVIYGIRQRQKFSHLEHHQSIGEAEGYNLYNSVQPNDDSPPPTPSRIVDKWEIHPRHLFFGEVLGTGAFGQVYQATLKLFPDSGDRSDTVPLFAQEWDHNMSEVLVAVKQLKEYADKTQKLEFMNEIRLMKTLGYHLNVVSMVGCITINEPLCLIVEQLPNGDMLHYLRKHREILHQNHQEDYYENACKLTYLDLLSFARQIARGMEFLSKKGFVHRDLATRNILVGEERTVKIGDFGLTRYVYDDKVYVNRKGGKLPLKWMSIEAIFDLMFSSASDVWAFGVVLFEIVTLGGTPYPTISNQDLLKFLKQGYRMEKPDNCDDELYGIMLDCWRHAAENRPNFTELIGRLERMLERCSTCDYLDITLDEGRDYYTCQGLAGDDCDDKDDTEDLDLVGRCDDNISYLSRASIWSASSTLTGRSEDSAGNCTPSKTLLSKAESISPGSSGRESMEAKDYDDDEVNEDGGGGDDTGNCMAQNGIVYTQVVTRATRPSTNTHDSGNVSFEMEMDLNTSGQEKTQHLIPKTVIDGNGNGTEAHWDDAFV